MNRPRYTAYTDGASSGNPGPAGWAALLNGEMLSGWLYRQTNNEMELFAIQQAVEHCRPHSTLVIYTDSRLAIGWLLHRWRCNTKPIASLVAMIAVTAMLRDITLEFIKVRGHAHDPSNELVDKEAVSMRKTARAYGA